MNTELMNLTKSFVAIEKAQRRYEYSMDKPYARGFDAHVPEITRQELTRETRNSP